MKTFLAIAVLIAFGFIRITATENQIQFYIPSFEFRINKPEVAR